MMIKSVCEVSKIKEKKESILKDTYGFYQFTSEYLDCMYGGYMAFIIGHPWDELGYENTFMKFMDDGREEMEKNYLWEGLGKDLLLAISLSRQVLSALYKKGDDKKAREYAQYIANIFNDSWLIIFNKNLERGGRLSGHIELRDFQKVYETHKSSLLKCSGEWYKELINVKLNTVNSLIFSLHGNIIMYMRQAGWMAGGENE